MISYPTKKEKRGKTAKKTTTLNKQAKKQKQKQTKK